MSWQEAVTTVNPPVYDDGHEGPPRINWLNGVAQARTGGVFYTKARHHPGDLPAPWSLSQRFDDEEGYEVDALAVALIGYRSEPFRIEADASGKKRYLFYPKWEPGLSIYTEWLVMVDGLDYPCVLASKGMTGMALGDALKTYRQRVLRPAEKRQKRALPLWSFWMPLSTEKDNRNKVVYTDTGHGSKVTRPVLTLPDMDEDDLLETLFVGADVLARGVDLRAEYEVWFKERRSAQAENAPAAPNGYDGPSDAEDPTQQYTDEMPY